MEYATNQMRPDQSAGAFEPDELTSDSGVPENKSTQPPHSSRSQVASVQAANSPSAAASASVPYA